jgi:hypothetical protein
MLVQDIGLNLSWESNIQNSHFQAQIVATKEMSEFVIQPRHRSRSPNVQLSLLCQGEKVTLIV